MTFMKWFINVYLNYCWQARSPWLKPQYSIGGFEWISINLSKSAAFSLQTSENNLKPPKNQLKKANKGSNKIWPLEGAMYITLCWIFRGYPENVSTKYYARVLKYEAWDKNNELFTWIRVYYLEHLQGIIYKPIENFLIFRWFTKTSAHCFNAHYMYGIFWHFDYKHCTKYYGRVKYEALTED